MRRLALVASAEAPQPCAQGHLLIMKVCIACALPAHGHGASWNWHLASPPRNRLPPFPCRHLAARRRCRCVGCRGRHRDEAACRRGAPYGLWLLHCIHKHNPGFEC